MRARTWAVAAMAVVGVAAGATPASAASDGKARCIQEAAKAGLVSGDINPGTVNLVGGIDGDDTFTGQTASTSSVALAATTALTPSPRETSFSAREGNDRVGTPNGGTFNGGDGVRFMNGGTFNGGEGSDIVLLLTGGTFDGGEGSDGVSTLNGGTFNGGEGDDSVNVRVGETFNQD